MVLKRREIAHTLKKELLATSAILKLFIYLDQEIFKGKFKIFSGICLEPIQNRFVFTSFALKRSL